MSDSKTDLKILLVVFGIVAILPVFIHDDLYLMNILVMCLIWGVVAASWDVIMGFAGIFAFSQIAFFVIGAYSSGIIALHYGVSPWLGMIFGSLIAGAGGILVSLPCLKLEGAHIALITFAVHMILEPFLKSDTGRLIGTGGTQGLLEIPPLSVGGFTFSSFQLLPWFYTAFIISFICLLILYKMIHSSWGLAFVALRDSGQFANFLGVNGFKYKLAVFSITAALTGLIGGFYAHYVSVLSTRILGLDLFLMLMVIMVIGGVGRFPGAFIGSFIVTFGYEFLRPVGTYRPVILGGLTVLLILFLPNGIMGLPLKKGVQKMRETINGWI
jgi:branched-chain amino acid transport system permease protein